MILTANGEKQMAAMEAWDQSAVHITPQTTPECAQRRYLSKKRAAIIGTVSCIFIVALTLAAILVYFFFAAANQNIVKFTQPLTASSDPSAKQEVTADPDENVVEYHVSNNQQDNWIVDDFNRDMKVMKVSTDAGFVCYVTPLNRSSATEPDLVVPSFGNVTDGSSSTLYMIASSPVADSSFLGATAADLCSGLPVYWVQPECSSSGHQVSANTVPVLSTTISPINSRKRRQYVGNYNGDSNYPCNCACNYCYCCCNGSVTCSVSGSTLTCHFYCSVTSTSPCNSYYFYKSTVQMC